jgi:16S rRNA (guanine(966)-N(2))-methyltransferase RsmD
MRPVLRIAGGKARGRRLAAPSGREVRPSPARVRIAIFNMLSKKAEGAQVLDLFAGTGSLGLEALSRGARSCLFVEQRADALRALARNVETLGFEEMARVRRGDAFRSLALLESVEGRIDLVFVDPPHRYWLTRKRQMIRLLEKLAGSDAISKEAVWVLGHPKGSPDSEEIAFLGRLDRRAYGDAHITLAH